MPTLHKIGRADLNAIRPLRKLRWGTLIFTQHKLFSGVYFRLGLLVVLILIMYSARRWLTEYPWFSLPLQILVYYVILNLLFSYAKTVLIGIYVFRHPQGVSGRDKFRLAINRLSWILNHLVFLFFLLHVLHVGIVSLLTSISIFAVALVLIFREHITNFINGIQLMFSPIINIKDYVKIGDSEGRIRDINLAHTELVTATGNIVFLPNNVVAAKEIINYSRGETKTLEIYCIAGLEHLHDIEHIQKAVLAQITEAYPLAIPSTAVWSGISKLEKDAVTVRFDITLQKYSYTLERAIRQECLAIFAKQLTNSQQKKQGAKSA